MLTPHNPETPVDTEGSHSEICHWGVKTEDNLKSMKKFLILFDRVEFLETLLLTVDCLLDCVTSVLLLDRDIGLKSNLQSLFI